MKLSILICSLLERKQQCAKLLKSLKSQISQWPSGTVEVIVELDNRERTIGAKRNALLDRSTGDYVVFVDDDDTVSSDYVSELLVGISNGYDAICVQGLFTINGDKTTESPFIDTPYGPHTVSIVNGRQRFLRGLQHLDAIKREIATSVRFPDSSFTEDYTWGTELERTGKVKTWYSIDHPVYFYDFWDNKPANGKCNLAVVMPVLNHVYTTYKSVESLLQATNDPNFVLIMVDDCSEEYSDVRDYAMDLYRRVDRRFKYIRNTENLGVNASWNIGITAAQALNASYIAVVNNDVMFSKDWDVALKKSLDDPGVGVISPLSTYGNTMPLDWPRGSGRDVNPAGYRGYMPLLGACFMAKAETFVKVGPFPVEEGLKIYFGDNWLAIACQALGLQCGYDSDSYVHHLLCVTTKSLDNGPIWEKEGPAFDALCSKLGRTMQPFALPDEVSA